MARASAAVTNTAYPTHADYDLAVRYTSKFVLDPVLRLGTPRSRSGVAVSAGGQLLSYPGGFAKVYIVDCGGRTYALRVWLHEIQDVAHRYQLISEFLQKQKLSFFVEHFEFISNGILVLGKRFPLLRMEWIEGYSLRDFIKQGLGQPDLMNAAADAFAGMIKGLHEARVGHGDLQGENMILRVNNGAVNYKLIDYDTLIVPSLLGQPVNSTGLPSYQHPNRSASTVSTEKDDFFSELVIYLSLKALATDGSLWAKFPKTGRDKELLFEAVDYNSAHPTSLFRRLHAMGGVIQKLAVILWNFSRCQSIAHLIPLETAIDLATKVTPATPQIPPNNRPRTAFDEYLSSKLRDARASIPLPTSWLDDTAFHSKKTRKRSGGARSAPTGAPMGHARPTEPSFADLVSGLKTVGPPPSPASPASLARPAKVSFAVKALIIGSVAVIIYFLLISGNSSERVKTPNRSEKADIIPTTSKTEQESPIRSTAPGIDSAEAAPAGEDTEWDRLVRSLRERAKKESVGITPQPAPEPLPTESTVEAPSTPAAVTYRVVNVSLGDNLNVRAGPGSDYAIVAMLPPGFEGIQLEGGRYANGETIWQEISVAGLRGFVNEVYLEAVP